MFLSHSTNHNVFLHIGDGYLVTMSLRLATFLTATDAVDTGESCSEL